MRPKQEPKPKKSIFWDSVVDRVEQFHVLVLNCLSSDTALGIRARERTALDDHDVFGLGDALVGIVTRVEFPRSSYDFFLELLRAHGTLLRSLDEQGGRTPEVANHNALGNKFATGITDVVLDRPELGNHKCL